MSNVDRTAEGAEGHGALVVLITAPSLDVAERLAQTLVGERLAACVNVLPEVTSVYRWKGEVQRDHELLCLVKTTQAAFEALRARVLALHPYELPEVIALPLTAGHLPYLAWIAESVTAGGG